MDELITIMVIKSVLTRPIVASQIKDKISQDVDQEIPKNDEMRMNELHTIAEMNQLKNKSSNKVNSPPI